ncbi:uncharacterized protein LOC142317359 isoform X2 [Lycorma delicatula]|uniref:uncharacterized protein LOC142317359 isoform X2 n=1 Tax=Lycorma delicatula TaxID=130591 RepID=UPI003F517D36
MPRESIRHQDKPVKRTSSPQQMTRQTLQALSAAPRSRLISTDTWIQTKRKPKQENYNYQHWLIQEAEHRRITELQQRQAAVPPRRPAPPHPSAYPGQQYIAPIREAGWQQQQQPSCQQKQQQPQQWASPPTQSLPQGQQRVHGSDVLNMNMFGIPLIGADICGFQKMLQLHFVRDGINLVHFIPSHVLIILMIVFQKNKIVAADEKGEANEILYWDDGESIVKVSFEYVKNHQTF